MKKAKVVIFLSVIGILIGGFAVFNNRKPEPQIWVISHTPLADSVDIEDMLREKYPNSDGRKIKYNCVSCLGDNTAVSGFIKQANNASAMAVITIGNEVTREALKLNSDTPLIACCIDEHNDLAASGDTKINLYCVVDKSSINAYAPLLISKDFSDSGAVLMPSNFKGYKDEYKEFADLYRKISNKEVNKIEVDTKTCAQFSDVVAAYNMLSKNNIKLLYIINDGNISKYIGPLVKQAKKMGITVISGGQSAVCKGSLMATEPDNENRVKLIIDALDSIKSGGKPRNFVNSKYVVYYDKNEAAVSDLYKDLNNESSCVKCVAVSPVLK